MQEYNVLYKIKELEKVILKNLALPEFNENNECTRLHKSTPTQMRIVDYILNNIDKEAINQKNIEKALNLSKATVSDVLNRMEKNGLIERNINPNDTRSKQILLSEKAKKFLEINKNKLQELERKAEANITQEELQLFCDVISKMLKNLEENEI